MTESDFGGGGGSGNCCGPVVVIADAATLDAEVEAEGSSSSSGLGTTTVVGGGREASCNGLAPRISVSSFDICIQYSCSGWPAVNGEKLSSC